tara:strand:- start:25 stop:462 length:438 start_codon:yes stop_codon:yes gene_type:complete
MFENRNKLGQFKKGKSGNPRGRPREGVGVPRVYLAYYKSEGKYISKIGISSNCSKRLRNIQYGSPEKLDFIKFNPTFYALNIEQKMLKEHKKNNFRGEWFKMKEHEFSLLVTHIQIASEILSKDTINERIEAVAEELVFMKNNQL